MIRMNGYGEEVDVWENQFLVDGFSGEVITSI